VSLEGIITSYDVRKPENQAKKPNWHGKATTKTGEPYPEELEELGAKV